jgi:hypothetical protein
MRGPPACLWQAISQYVISLMTKRLKPFAFDKAISLPSRLFLLKKTRLALLSRSYQDGYAVRGSRSREPVAS